MTEAIPRIPVAGAATARRDVPLRPRHPLPWEHPRTGLAVDLPVGSSQRSRTVCSLRTDVVFPSASHPHGVCRRPPTLAPRHNTAVAHPLGLRTMRSSHLRLITITVVRTLRKLYLSGAVAGLRVLTASERS